MDELRALAKAARRKAPGPDGIPPYVLAQLLPAHFSLVHHYVCLMHHSRTAPASVSQSLTFCIYKQKDKWQDGDMWRPVACGNSIYRLLAPWVYTPLQRDLTPLVSPRQFGAVKGRSTAQAHARLLQQISELAEDGVVVLFDLYHAFNHPP